jgi:sugar-phosphatase
MIYAVIFDMDGLLVDSEPLWYRAEAYAFGSVGLNLSDDDMRQTMGYRIDELVEYRYRESPWNGASQKDVEAMIVDKVIELIKSEVVPLPGTKNILEFFKEKSLPMAIASSSYGAVIDAVIDTLDIRKYFVYTHSAQHEKYGKPHPGVYLSTAIMLGVSPDKCLVFEDSPMGVLAAKAAKMKCVAIPDADHKDNKYIQIADLVIDSLNDFNEEIFSSF